MRRLSIAAILLLLAGPVHAQPIQSASCLSSQGPTCALPGVKAGDTWIAVEDSSDPIAGASGTVAVNGFYGPFGASTLAYGTASGNLSITLGPNTSTMWLAEYPPLVFDAASGQANNCCIASFPVGPVTLTATDTVFALMSYSHGTLDAAPTIAGYTADVTGGDFVLEEGQAAAQVYSLSLPQTKLAYGVKLIAFKPVGPPPPPPTSKNFTFSGQLLWTDNTPVQGNIQVQQFYQNVWNVLLNLTPDASGNVSGTVSIQTNFSDIVTLTFELVDATGNVIGYIQPSAPGAMFQNISSVSGFKLFVVKSGCVGASLCTIGPGTVFGTIQ